MPGPRAAWITGPRADRLLIAKETRDCDILGVRLRPAAARQVLGVPAADVNRSLVDLSQFWGLAAEDLREQLVGLDAPGRIQIVERALLARLASGGSEATDVGVVDALCDAVDTGRYRSVAALAAAFGLTHRQVIAYFDAHVGLKPKAYHRVQRLRKVMAAARGTERVSWTRVAVEAGYYDQAHLIHDFRRLTGLTPVEYASRRMRVGDGFVPFKLAATVGDRGPQQESTSS
jgi:AraC-like DNA-binding protein